MARKARERSIIGIYMVQLKSVDDVLFEYNDRINILEKLNKDKINLLGYTLLNNSFFFVIKEDYRSLDTIIRNTTIDFVKKYNKLHNRNGKVFAGRFISCPAQSEFEVWSLVSNVHSASKFSLDTISSCDNYFSNKYIKSEYARKYFKSEEEFNNLCTGLQLDTKKIKMSDEEVSNYIINTFQVQPQTISKLPKSFIEKILTQIFKATKASVRQVARVSSLSLRMLWDFSKKIKTSKKTNDNMVKDNGRS